MPEPAPPPRDGDDAPSDAAGWLAPYVRDPSLWPVTAVVVAIFALFGAAGLLLAFVERSPLAIAAVCLAFWISVDVAWRERRRGGRTLTAALATLWLASVAAAVAARRGGWF